MTLEYDILLERHPERRARRANRIIELHRAAKIASVISRVFKRPPRSVVRTEGFAKTAATALRILDAARTQVGSASQSSIIAMDRIMATGLATPWPAIFGAVPCAG